MYIHFHRRQPAVSRKLHPGMKVQISREKGRKEFNHKLMKIVYEDAYIIVIEKMQGLLSVNTDRQKERTAYTILNEYVQRSGKQHRVHIVHRLDRDTSGLMMFAKDEKTQRTLRDNWHDIVTDRRYVAVVVGEMEKDILPYYVGMNCVIMTIKGGMLYPVN